MKEFTLYIFNKRGGKVVKVAESEGGLGMLGMYALSGVTGGRVGLLVDHSNEIVRVYIGRKERTPHISYNDKLGIMDYLERYIIDDTHIDITKLLDKYSG